MAPNTRTEYLCTAHCIQSRNSESYRYISVRVTDPEATLLLDCTALAVMSRGAWPPALSIYQRNSITASPSYFFFLSILETLLAHHSPPHPFSLPFMPAVYLLQHASSPSYAITLFLAH